MLDPHTLTIDPRFNGPRTSGNGGWVAGSLARRLGSPAVEVSLRAPPPLGVALALSSARSGHLALHHGDTLLADAQQAELAIEPPASPGYGAAQSAGALGRMLAGSRDASPYGHCFGCGIARADGLRIIPGPVGDSGIVASTWTPAAAVAEADGTVGVEVTWAALDCPAGYAWSNRLGNYGAMMTARMTAQIDAPLSAGQAYIVIGWPIEQQGRKLFAGTAIYDIDGTVRARSAQLWLLPKN